MDEYLAIEAEVAEAITAALKSSLTIESGLEVSVIEADASVYPYTEVDVNWAKNLAIENGVDAVAVPVLYVNTTGVRAYGLKSANGVYMSLQIIGADGTNYGEGIMVTNHLVSGVKNFDAYRAAASQATNLVPDLITAIFN